MQGIQGPPGIGSFAYFSNIGCQHVEAGNPVAFNQTPIPAVLPVDIGFVSPYQVIITTTGVYELTAYVLPCCHNATFALYVDGIEVPLSRYTAISAGGHVYIQTLLTVGLVPAVVTLVNVGNKCVDICEGNQPNTISASLLVNKLS